MSVGNLDHVLIVYSHHRPWRERKPYYRLGQGKSGRQRGTATDQMDKRGTLDQEDNNQDVIKMSDGHRNVVIR